MPIFVEKHLIPFTTGLDRKRKAKYKLSTFSRLELIQLFYCLQQQLRSEDNLAVCLSRMRSHLENPKLRTVVTDLIHQLNDGHTLSQSMAKYPRIFDSTVISYVQLGENNRQLDNTLGELITLLNSRELLAAKIKKHIITPTISTALLLLVSCFLANAILVDWMNQSGQFTISLAWYTQSFLAMTNFFQVLWPAMVILISFSIVLGFCVIQKINSARAGFDQFILSIPVIGPLVNKFFLSELIHTLSLAYGSNKSVLDGIKTANLAMKNQFIGNAVQQMASQIAHRSSVSDVFNNSGLFPQWIIHRIQKGEAADKLGSALDCINQYYRQSLDISLDRLAQVLQSILVFLLALFFSGYGLLLLFPLQ